MSIDQGNLKNLWQSLPASGTTYTPAQLSQRASTFQAKVKRRDIIEYVSWVAAFVAIIFVHMQNSGWGNWVITGLMLLGGFIAVSNYRRFAHGKSGPTQPSNDSLIKFMRVELTRQRDAAATMWRWYSLPFAPAILFLFAYRWLETGSNFMALTDDRTSVLMGLGTVTAIFAAITFWQWLQAAKYQRQLDALNRYMS